jgi:hypothetical protein
VAYPEKYWIVVEDPEGSMVEQIKFWVNTTLLLFVDGSVGSNIVWMKENTSMIKIQTRKCDSFFIDIARAVGVKSFDILLRQRMRVFNVSVGFLLTVIDDACKFLKMQGF